jgi:hypothetical protein
LLARPNIDISTIYCPGPGTAHPDEDDRIAPSPVNSCIRIAQQRMLTSMK